MKYSSMAQHEIKISPVAMHRMCASVQNERFTSGTIAAINRVYDQRQEVHVNRDRLEGKWKQLSGSVRERWGRLANDRLSVVAGKHDQLAGRYQEQYGINKEENERQLKEFLRRNRDWDPSRR
jgi:uncharacterized protein YjbJ (UPF0337 family)